MGCVICEYYQACSLHPPSYHRVELDKSEPTHGIFCGQRNHLVQKIKIVSLPKFAYTVVLTLRQHRPQSLQGYSLSDLTVFSKGPIKFPRVANKTGKQVLSYICHPKKGVYSPLSQGARVGGLSATDNIKKIHKGQCGTQMLNIPSLISAYKSL